MKSFGASVSIWCVVAGRDRRFPGVAAEGERTREPFGAERLIYGEEVHPEQEPAESSDLVFNKGVHWKKK